MVVSDTNQRIIKEVEEALPADTNTAQAIMDVLLIGKESVYRRMRGEVSFTIEELAKLAIRFNFSVDQILGSVKKEHAFVNVDFFDPQKKVEEYAEVLRSFIRFFRKMKKSDNAVARYAINTLPFIFYLSHSNLARFKYFKWLYQIGECNPYSAYNDLVLPQHIIDLQKSFVAESRCLKQSLIILDRNVFESMKYDVEYFYHLRLISKEDVIQIREEMLDLLDDLSQITQTGKFKSGQDVDVFLSNIDLEASYTHFEYENNQYGHLRLYGLSGVHTEYPTVCNMQKKWIDSLKRYSTLISGSAEMQRYDYLTKQREIINSLGR